MEDLQIIALYNARDSNAINQTSIKYGKLCYAVADGILHCKEDNEECVNDTYLTAWNTIPPENPDRLSAFLCRITRNLSLKKYEYNHAQKRRTDLEISLSELDDLLSDTVDVIREVESRELGETINCFLWALPSEERNLFVLRYFLFRSVKSMALNFGYTQSKVKSKLARMRKSLAVYLKNYYSKAEIYE